MSNSEFFSEMRQYERENNIQENYETDFHYGVSEYEKRRIKAQLHQSEVFRISNAYAKSEENAQTVAFSYLDKIAINASERARIFGQMRTEKDPETYTHLLHYKRQLDKTWQNLRSEYAVIFNALGNKFLD